MKKPGNNPIHSLKSDLYSPITTVLLIVGIFFITQIVAVILLGAYPAFKGWDEQESLRWLTESTIAQFANMLLVAIFAVTGVWYLLRRLKVPMKRIGLVRPQLRDIGYALIGYGLYFVSYIILIIIIKILFPELNLEQEQDIGFKQVSGTLQTVLVFFSLVILPPIWEEIIFRGFLFTNLRAKFRLRWAILLTSVLFAIVHLQFGNGQPLLWVAAIDTFILSCYLCILRERSGSLWPPILLHAAKNSVAFYFLFIR